MAAATGPFGDEMIRRAGSVEAVQFPISRESVTGRSVVERRTVHVHDLAAEPEDEYPVGRELQRRFGHRTLLATPLLREGEPVGAMVMFRTEVNPFSEKQARLSQAFADQAVIAVENVRLFRELEERTAELTRSVGQLTALGEISRAVSSTLDVETVLQTVVSRASQLAGSDGGAIYEYDDATQEFHIRATHNLDPALVAALRAFPLHRGEGAMGRATETREPVQIADIQVSGASEPHPRHTAGSRLPGAAVRAACPRGSDHRQPVAKPQGARRIPGGSRGGAQDLRHPVVPSHPKCPPLRRDRGEEPAARGGEPAQIRVPRQHVARAPHAAERHHRLLRGAQRAHAR